MANSLAVATDGADLGCVHVRLCQQLLGGIGEQLTKRSIEYSHTLNFFFTAVAYGGNVSANLCGNLVLVGNQQLAMVLINPQHGTVDSVHELREMLYEMVFC